MSYFKDKPKCSCIKCKKEFFVGMLNQHTKSCDKLIEKDNTKFLNLVLWQDFVQCGICGKLLKENNNAHIIKLHNYSIAEYDLNYPNHPRISIKGKISKNNFVGGVSEELSNKLKYSHTLDGYIEKYGEDIGAIRYNASKTNKSYVKTKQSYKERYGDNWKDVYDNHNKSKGYNLEKYILKYGEIEGTLKYNKKCMTAGFRMTLDGYIERYGDIDGYLKWKDKNDLISQGNSRLDKNQVNKIDEYYCMVNRLTRKIYDEFKYVIDPNNIRSVDFHLDHRVSKCYGFMNKIHPIYIASLYNLEMKSRHENCKKQEDNDMCPLRLQQSVDADRYYINIFNEYKFNF